MKFIVASRSSPREFSVIWSKPFPQPGYRESSLPRASSEAFCQKRGRCSTPSGPAMPELIRGIYVSMMFLGKVYVDERARSKRAQLSRVDAIVRPRTERSDIRHDSNK